MRKVTRVTTEAFRGGDSRTVGNSRTDGLHYWLHGNLIARREHTGGAPVQVTLAGWNTVTTRDRLNGIAQAFGIPVRFAQRDWAPIVRHTVTGAEVDVDSRGWYDLDELARSLARQEGNA